MPAIPPPVCPPHPHPCSRVPSSLGPEPCRAAGASFPGGAGLWPRLPPALSISRAWSSFWTALRGAGVGSSRRPDSVLCCLCCWMIVLLFISLPALLAWPTQLVPGTSACRRGQALLWLCGPPGPDPQVCCVTDVLKATVVAFRGKLFFLRRHQCPLALVGGVVGSYFYKADFQSDSIFDTIGSG